MAILALDASTEACAVGLLLENGEQIERFEIAPRQHTVLLPKMLDSVIKESGIKKIEISACIAGIGPGAFTGIRIGVSTIQGIALGLNIPCFGVSSLQAIAQQALNLTPSINGNILAVIDARMDEIYCAEYSVKNQSLGEEQLISNASFELNSNIHYVAGSGVHCIQDKLINIPSQSEIYPTASSLFDIYLQNKLSPVAAEDLQPSYIRNQVTHQKS